MIRINDILDKIAEYNPGADLDVIDRAYVYSARVHSGQMRLSGEPYLSHPLEVAAILADMKLDVESIAAALLHDVIEDTHATEQEILEMFGPGILHIVAGVTKISKLTFSTKAAQQAESLRKMILAMADDIRVVLIKLADRIHNMRTLKFHKSQEKQRSIAQETLDIYAPIAARLGIFWIKQELEDLSFLYTHPEEYASIDLLVNKAKEERESYIATVMERVKEKLANSNIEADVKGRYKQHYSIYHKMVTQNLEFEELYDIVAFRIIVDTVSRCYEVMGLIHSMWKPISGKIKDYIGVPKPNMYQSLHTTVIGPRGDRVELQIRTREMDKIAESGIAAHWSYKQGGGFDEKTGEAFAWIRNLVENQENFSDPDEFLENVRIDLYSDEIYIFTPHGEIKTLPKGATPVDFAYLIHTEVGDQCTGARVNGKLVTLTHGLITGDTIEIVTTKGSHPSADWLNFVKTVKAKTKIRQWVRTRERERSITLGREMCEKQFRKKGHSFAALVKSGVIAQVSDGYGFKQVEDLIAHVGFGKITPVQIMNRALPGVETQKEPSIFDKLIKSKIRKKSRDGIIVKGLDDILVRFSKCCNPLPGDPIIGYITQGQGVTVHRKNCVTVQKMDPERQIDVEWSNDFTESYPALIRVRSTDRFGLLADVVAAITKNNANIINASTDTSELSAVSSYFTISVESTDRLRKIMTEIRKVKQVKDVKRMVPND
ncbi:RelA [Desulforapulum autotrophicum HRM2]|uniref:RelA n=1 Tax=Desulforapulum autotrophicum (strain ATCC 43914 / DSM 3382 / VKM B-1955 / HRM2) TaxID=177437 RepID=C0QM35_DESAH|nr:bifunctional (p)ppGpp synthetase/guanosine-3',5'-bis(diphosphate) 3'-pyrophosphohydrolase [Desulforapulum autotrophicum]ACN14341.1 RelA [Desulforapulum autotrophicum HRM2]